MKPRPASLLVVVLVAALLPGCAYISRASQSSTGVQGNSFSNAPSVSANGRWVAFNSAASNLVAGDTNGTTDVFVRDNLSKTVARVSVATNGTQGDGASAFPSISDDGRVVCFSSAATNFYAFDTNGADDVYCHNRDADSDGIYDEAGAIATIIMSLTSTGNVASSGSSTMPAVNGDGLGVVWESTAALVPGDTNGVKDVYAAEAASSFVPVLISTPSGTSGVADGSSERPTVNSNGTVVAFETDATNLVAGDTNGVRDVVVWDAHSSPATMTRATGSTLADADVLLPSLSRDAGGRFVAFASAATNLVPTKTNTVLEVYVFDRSTGTLTAESRPPFGFDEPNGNSLSPEISADGTRVAFHSSATNLVADDTNGQPDIFVRDRASDLTQVASTAFLLDHADNGSQVPAISADGNYVAFDSLATNLVTPDTNSTQDVFTRAAIVPQIDGILRVETGTPRFPWGASTVRIRGKGFGTNISVELGAGVTILGVTHTPTQIDVQVNVANGTSGTRNVAVKNLATSGVADGYSAKVCFGCLSIQRWVTFPDPVASSGLFFLISNNEFTDVTDMTAPAGQVLGWSPPDVLVVQLFAVSSGAHDITLTDTVNGTVTCAGCLHVG